MERTFIAIDFLTPGAATAADATHKTPICECCENAEAMYMCKVLWKILEKDANVKARFKAHLCLPCFKFLAKKEKQILDDIHIAAEEEHR